MAELSVMDRINMILSDPEKATMTLAQIVSEEIREFKASPEYAIMLEAESYYRNRSDVQRKTVDVANRSNTKIEHPILKKLVDQKANYLLSKPWTVDTKNSAYGEALTKVFDQTFRRKIKSLGKGAIKSGIAWIQPYFRDGKLAFMRIPSTELVPLWRDAERTELDAFIRFYDQVIYIGTRKHIITHAEFWWPGGVKWFKTDAFAGTGAGNFYVDKEHGDEASDYTEPHFVVDNKPYNWEECPIAWLKYNEEELPLCYYIKDLIDDINWQTSVTSDVLRDVAKFIYMPKAKTYEEWYDEQVARNGQGSVEVERQKVYNRKADLEQFEAYSERLGADAPSDVDTFQRLKYSKPDEWSDLKGLYSYKGRVPEATKADFQTYKKIKATGIYGTVRVPAAKIDTSALTLDVAHINERRHGVTQEEAVSYIKNAAFSLKRRHWTGETFLNYYSEEGASYVRTSDNVIRTSFKKDEFDKKTKSAMEVLKNGE